MASSRGVSGLTTKVCLGLTVAGTIGVAVFYGIRKLKNKNDVSHKSPENTRKETENKDVSSHGNKTQDTPKTKPKEESQLPVSQPEKVSKPLEKPKNESVNKKDSEKTLPKSDISSYGTVTDKTSEKKKDVKEKHDDISSGNDKSKAEINITHKDKETKAEHAITTPPNADIPSKDSPKDTLNVSNKSTEKTDIPSLEESTSFEVVAKANEGISTSGDSRQGDQEAQEEEAVGNSEGPLSVSSWADLVEDDQSKKHDADATGSKEPVDTVPSKKQDPDNKTEVMEAKVTNDISNVQETKTTE